MEKKLYLTPESTVVKINVQNLLEGSVNDSPGYGGDGGNPDESRQAGGWDEEE